MHFIMNWICVSLDGQRIISHKRKTIEIRASFKQSENIAIALIYLMTQCQHIESNSNFFIFSYNYQGKLLIMIYSQTIRYKKNQCGAVLQTSGLCTTTQVSAFSIPCSNYCAIYLDLGYKKYFCKFLIFLYKKVQVQEKAHFSLRSEHVPSS